MKRLAVTLSLILFGAIAGIAQVLTVEVGYLKPEQAGKVVVGIFDKEEDWPDDDKELIKKAVPVTQDSFVLVSFPDLKPGTYSISVYHDKNSNGQFDTNFLGIPQEGYGFSKNKYGTFGPPSFEETNFTVTDSTSTELEISMKYDRGF